MLKNISNAFGKGFVPGKVRNDYESAMHAMRARWADKPAEGTRPPGVLLQRVKERTTWTGPSGFAGV